MRTPGTGEQNDSQVGRGARGDKVHDEDGQGTRQRNSVIIRISSFQFPSGGHLLPLLGGYIIYETTIVCAPQLVVPEWRVYRCEPNSG